MFSVLLLLPFNMAREVEEVVQSSFITISYFPFQLLLFLLLLSMLLEILRLLSMARDQQLSLKVIVAISSKEKQ